MNILILSYFYPPDISPGSFRIQALVREFEKDKYRKDSITVIASTPNRYKIRSITANNEQHYKNIRVIRAPVPSHNSKLFFLIISYLFYAYYVLKFVKNKKFDIVFSTTSKLLTGFLGSFVSMRTGAVFYLDIRDIFPDSLKYIHPLIFRFLNPFLLMIESYSIKKASKINLISFGFFNYYKKRYPNKLYSFFTNGIDPEFILFRKKNIFFKKIPLLLYAGNIGEGQGLHKIIPPLASKLYGKMNFRIIGDGSLKVHLVKEVGRFGISNVEILDPMNRKSLIEEYNRADILFVHLNNLDCFNKVLPSKIFEYAASGRPILAGVHGYAKKFIIDNIPNAEVFPPGKVSDALHAIKRLDLQHTSRKAFINRFNRKDIMKNLATDISNSCI